MRYFFEISYSGKNYNGWQTQHNALGVQAVVEKALSTLLRSPLRITGSGRTDTGVHCQQQFFHCDIPARFREDTLMKRLNSYLPNDIAILSIHPVRPDAHARYSAKERAYRYRITRTKNPMLEGLALYYFKPLNLATMRAASALLVGEHNFKCFSKAKTDANHFLCKIRRATWRQSGEDLVFDVAANRFLRGMVRAMVGTLLDVGSGVTSLEDFKAILRSADRRQAGQNVPPHGLYLMRVRYPVNVFI